MLHNFGSRSTDFPCTILSICFEYSFSPSNKYHPMAHGMIHIGCGEIRPRPCALIPRDRSHLASCIKQALKNSTTFESVEHCEVILVVGINRTSCKNVLFGKMVPTSHLLSTQKSTAILTPRSTGVLGHCDDTADERDAPGGTSPYSIQLISSS